MGKLLPSAWRQRCLQLGRLVRMQMEWDETQDIMKVTLDGEFFNSQTFSEADPANTGRPENPFRGKRHYMILNLAIGFVGGDPTPTTFPMKFEIDYVRVYKEAQR